MDEVITSDGLYGVMAERLAEAETTIERLQRERVNLNDLLRYACAGMIERSIATGHADSVDQAIDVLFEAYDEKCAQHADAERERDEARTSLRAIVGVVDRACNALSEVAALAEDG